MTETVWVICRKRQPGYKHDYYLRAIGNFGKNHFDPDIFMAMKWEDKPNLYDLPHSIADDKSLILIQVIFNAEIIKREIP